MLTIRHNGREIATGTIGSRDVMYRDREFTAPFIRGASLCDASSPLYVELCAVLPHPDLAERLVRSLPAAGTVTIRDEGKY